MKKKNFVLVFFLSFCVSCAHAPAQKNGAADVMGAGNIKVVFAKTFTLEPGVWNGFCLGIRDDSVVYLPEITYAGTAPEGFSIEKIVLQYEYNLSKKAWYAVLRVGIPEQSSPVRIHLRVLEVKSSVAVPALEESSEDGSCCD